MAQPGEIQQDDAGHRFVDVGDHALRVTLVPRADRAVEKDWSGSDVLRVCAYRDETNSLHRGAEFPIGSAQDALDLVQAILTLYRARETK